MRRLAFWRDLEACLREGDVFLAMVAESTAHSPGTAGARLFVDRSGRTRGTIGGGVMELRLLERAREVLAAGQTLCELVDLRHRREVDGDEERSGMICAGRQTNLYLTLSAERDLAAVSRWIACLESEAGTLRIDASGLALRSGTAPRRLVRGESWRFEEPALERRRLAILGGGHCGLALARAMSRLGWRVTVFETRRELVDAAGDEQDADFCWIEDFRHAGGRIEHAPITPVVVMTTDVPNDVRALAGVLGRPFPLIGAMGSEAKIEQIRRRLGEQGFGERELARLVAPVGFEIGSETPEEIAVSVAAQLLARRDDWLAEAGGEDA